MKCLLLAAGYATRLYPITRNFPKPLLTVGGKTILDWLVDDIDSVSAVEEYIVITNHKFVHHFEDWAATRKEKITVVDDLTSSNENRLGAVCDIQYAIDELELDDDLFIIACDNVLDFSLVKFIEYALNHGTSCTMRYHESDEERLKKSGVSIIDDNEVLIGLQEKPDEPKSNWCTPPFYYYIRDDVKKIEDAIDDGCGTDAPGSLASWMCTHAIMHSMEMPGSRYDIGTLDNYRSIKDTYAGITK